MRSAKWVLFAGASLVISTLVAVGLLLGLDLYLHHRYEGLVGLNVRGYRGPIAKRKPPGEQRLVVLGGSTAFGYGVPYNQSFPARLERRLNDLMHQTGQPPVSVINLAGNSEGAFAFTYTLRDYAYLQPDVVILYEGYNDMGTRNTYVFRHASPIFQLTGYFPIFPLIFREKAMVLRQGEDLEAAYRGQKTVFKPNLAHQVSAAALEAAVNIHQSLEQQVGRLSATPKDASATRTDTGCWEPWGFYCEQVDLALNEAFAQEQRVLVVTQPYIADGHVDQQQALAGMLRERFSEQPRVRYVNLGWTVDLKDRSLCYDGMHLTAQGNERIADALVEPVRELLAVP